MEKVYHTPALLYPCMEGLAINPSGIYVDVTFGGGGHSREILSRLGSEGRLFGFDQDLDAMQNIIDDARFTFVRSNFRYISNFMEYHGVDKVDGILADLGVSFHHFDESGRGFSFRFDGKLDMRMNQHAVMTAADVLNRYTEEQLADLFYYYGELKSARKIASVVVAHRAEKKFEMISDLVNIVEPLVGKDKQKKNLACLFQALRIEVNREMEVLKKLLQSSLNLLNPGGRLVVLTYHSLEDRLVKNFMKSGNFEGKVEQDFFGNRMSPFKLVNNKVIVPDCEEIEQNPRSRSAKLRIAEFLG
ncbi:MAG: 16S rRNA (cytosine(1402)-N(4))-methyltransferase RsmH [Paludibacteraceae bacterium]|nr:16S rRNA (cytosine(1402)-N(4))-methyltransferase RsmH [Bacteroidales bacterium]MBO5133488.1 16S rRNA (cytosine(1402)-N(4))-methyltransferase RsmH [Paludibacteraceae bacterium]MBR6659870.1 16S rRNA (cytosine(1402)-N(4))-methyltransferase RsmH [Paludibacteraceae bacterium]